MRSGRDIPGRDGSNPAPDQPAPTFPGEAVRATIVGIVTTILAAWTVGAALELTSTPAPLQVAVYYLVVFGGLVRTGIAASGRWGSGSFRVDFGWWARPTDALRAVVVFWLAGLAGAVAVSPWRGDWTSHGDWAGSADTASAVVLAVVAVLAAPLLEELVFRGLLQRALTARYGAGPAILLQGAVFGLYHFNSGAGVDNVPNIVFIAAWGTVMGVAAHRYRRLGPTMFAHAFANTLATVALIAG